MRDAHRNLAITLREWNKSDGRWLVFGRPPTLRYCNSTKAWRGDERQVETQYVGGVISTYCQQRDAAWIVHALECGAAGVSQASRLKHIWHPYRLEWVASDVEQVTDETFNEVHQGLFSLLPWTGFDMIVAVSCIEHSDYVGDNIDLALTKIGEALDEQGILIMTLPIGAPMDYKRFKQFAIEEARDLIARNHLEIIDERLFRWNGEHFEACMAEDTSGCFYASTNGAIAASAVAAWTMCR